MKTEPFAVTRIAPPPVIPDGAGAPLVVWHSDGVRCVWSLTEAAITVATEDTVTVLHGPPGTPARPVRLPRNGVYLMHQDRILETDHR